nr:hypothetical protein [uncultured Caldimonas sp.]
MFTQEKPRPAVDTPSLPGRLPDDRGLSGVVPGSPPATGSQDDRPDHRWRRRVSHRQRRASGR